MGEHPPDFLTIEQARAVLNIGRTMAYREAALFVASGGELGAVPAIELKPRVLRVPRVALEELLGGPLTWPPPNLPDEVTTIEPGHARPPKPAGTNAGASKKRTSKRDAKRKTDRDQSQLPFTA